MKTPGRSILVCLLFTAVASFAQVPGLINYQGRLVNGTNLVSLSTPMVFRLYNVGTGGSPVYVETQTVLVVDGLYSLSLGQAPGQGTLQDAVTNEPLFLEVQVGSSALSPRERIASVHYALMAAGVTNGAITVNMLDTNTVDARYAMKGAAMPWVDVTGTTQQAVCNRGYVAHNAALVTVTLPTNPAVGDLVRVSGAGGGGWKLAQNAGQSIFTMNINGAATGALWSARTNAGIRSWRNMDASDDGMKLCAAASGDDGDFIYTSSDGGSTWAPRASSRKWQGLSSSGDGSVILAGVNGGYLYVSYDSGVTWTSRMTDVSRPWVNTAVSHDGSRMAAAVWGETSGGYIYTSSDSGSNWTAHVTDKTREWNGLACSSDGMTLVAGEYWGHIYTSSDGGSTWVERAAAGTGPWWGFACSADGTRMIGGPNYGSYLSFSSNSGATWSSNVSAGVYDWYCMASSSDGSKLLAVDQSTTGQLFRSVDGGASWVAGPGAPSNGWFGAASSADGSFMMAGGNYTPLYVYSFSSTTTPGMSGYVAGALGSAIEVQYAGSGLWLPLSHEGIISFY